MYFVFIYYAYVYNVLHFILTHKNGERIDFESNVNYAQLLFVTIKCMIYVCRTSVDRYSRRVYG